MAEFIGANALQNVAGSATFISTPVGEASCPISNNSVVAASDKVFWLSKNLQIMTLNVIPGVANAQIGELSARPIVSVKELLNTLDTEQPYGYGFFNENDKTVQFHVRTSGSPFNDAAIVYDLVNDTWSYDTGKRYNCVVKAEDKYYGFSDVNSSIYEDDVGFSDAGIPIDFRIVTQNLNQGTPYSKRYGGFYTMGAI